MLRRAAIAVYVTFAAIALSGQVANAQTTKPQHTQPSQDDAANSPASLWSQSLSLLADAMRGNDIDALTSLLDHGPLIRCFASDVVQSPERLLSATGGSRLLSIHAYLKTPTTLASDLAADLQNASGLPDATRERMIPSDETAARRANETATQWITQTLQPAKDQLVGVIVLWKEERSDTFGTPRTRPIFVLVKAQLVENQYVVRQVTFGDPLNER
jgi:hypothetical protein